MRNETQAAEGADTVVCHCSP